MRIIKTISEWNNIRYKNSLIKRSLGFVPTMGAIHKGHIALIKRSKKENDKTVVSIFINPTQFNSKNDYKSYPYNFESDLILLEKHKIDYLLIPTYDEIYPDNYNYKVTEKEFSNKLCGKYRKGHFEGVLTVVLKLLNIVKPDKVYFGEKDFQQMELVRGMIKAFFIDTELVSVKTVRDKNGLALSSRNFRLNKKELKTASEFPRLLKSDLPIEEIKSLLEDSDLKVEYVGQIGNRRYGAVYIGDVRLIDNFKIQKSRSKK
jgi:pantoate--beta-alanine ligase